MRPVLLPIVHGVAFKDNDKDYAGKFIKLIRSKLTDQERDYLIPIQFNYSNVTNQRQVEMFNAVDKGLDNEKLRLWKNIIGSDVTWSLIQAKGDAPSFFKSFNYDLATAIANAKITYPGAAVVCIGHSQGSQLLYSFFFEYFGQIDGFVSMGSPIAMNSGAWYPSWGRVPENLRFWDNYYHSTDFISSRLKTHPSESIRSFVNDFEVPKGWNLLYRLPDGLNLFGKWKVGWTKLVAGFMAHVGYWENDFVATMVAKRVKHLIVAA